MEADLEGCHLLSRLTSKTPSEPHKSDRADLTGAELRDARYSEGTRWPSGFDVAASEAVRVKANETAQRGRDACASCSRIVLM